MEENKVEKVETEYNWSRNKEGKKGGLIRNFIKFAPNDLCVCGSKIKYKKCCKNKKAYYLKKD